jgi:hypothetical protein
VVEPQPPKAERRSEVRPHDRVTAGVGSSQEAFEVQLDGGRRPRCRRGVLAARSGEGPGEMVERWQRSESESRHDGDLPEAPRAAQGPGELGPRKEAQEELPVVEEEELGEVGHVEEQTRGDPHGQDSQGPGLNRAQATPLVDEPQSGRHAREPEVPDEPCRERGQSQKAPHDPRTERLPDGGGEGRTGEGRPGPEPRHAGVALLPQRRPQGQRRAGHGDDGKRGDPAPELGLLPQSEARSAASASPPRTTGHGRLRPAGGRPEEEDVG